MPKTVKSINNMPQMGVAFRGWQNTINLLKITQTVDLGDVSESSEEISFKGVIQPLGAKQIMLKPEGQRAWQWLQIHCFSGETDLDVNDRIEHCGVKYKVMKLIDFSLNGYIEYHIVEDYENE